MTREFPLFEIEEIGARSGNESSPQAGDKIALLGAAISAFGDMVAVIGGIIAIQEDQISDQQQAKQTADLQKQIDELKKQLDQNVSNSETSNKLLLQILDRLDR
ncbi:hypothetical protein [Sporosarcina sp. HYO08]|uniref:hypothetical protein n=1 Tax=Sporosarcina sp. HYO08 TaxID=1759557 RepID=UPI000798C202|nr:hypothetical protein [Sporosarcina sp. HYO08]KXH81908.1 hypothetical protein AU377_06500 [Sporosarcina sp. HYO08]